MNPYIGFATIVSIIGCIPFLIALQTNKLSGFIVYILFIASTVTYLFLSVSSTTHKVTFFDQIVSGLLMWGIVVGGTLGVTVRSIYLWSNRHRSKGDASH
jgi:hypothetical protein